MPHVLLAEDNPVNQRVALKMLERLGYEVDLVDDGAKAVEAATRSEYAAVLMDVQMPEMDGYEATREIRRREGDARRTPIIAMTAHAMQSDRDEALRAGMDDYITKPVRAEVLREVLERRIGGAQEPAEAPREDAAEESLLDLSVLENLRSLQGEDEPDLLEELIGMFLEDTESRLENLREAAREGDADRISREAHALRGSAWNMGAPTMARVCEELERAGDSGQLDGVSDLLGTLEREFGRVRPALQTMLQE